MQADRLYANAPRVVHEMIDGEVIVIDLATGTYFSLQNGAADVWALLMAGHSVPEMVETLSKLHDQDAESIREQLEPFLESLLTESLVVSNPNGHVEKGAVPPLSGSGSFSATLEKHTDMTELILLDPVHDVDTVGWPHVPDGQRASNTQAS